MPNHENQNFHGSVFVLVKLSSQKKKKKKFNQDQDRIYGASLSEQSIALWSRLSAGMWEIQLPSCFFSLAHWMLII